MAKLDFNVQSIDVKAQKIDDSTLKTFGIILADFQVDNKLGRSQFF